MDLPVVPPVAPMLAKSVAQVPRGAYSYEPKWDGFRCIVFRDGADVELGSRNGRSLTRYFPDVVAAVRRALPERCVVDAEIVVAGPGGLDFDALSQRIHPAASRVTTLAQSTPASIVAFDVLALGDEDLRTEPFSVRRATLVDALGWAPELADGVHLTPATIDASVAEDWFCRFEGAGLDGVVAKSLDLPYVSDKRVMFKIKHERTADFVVAGFRWYKGDGAAVGSLMLGLYHGKTLSHVGVIGSFTAERRRALLEDLAPYREPGVHPWAAWASSVGGSEHQRLPGATSRWNAHKDLSFEPLRPDLVVEAAYEHLQGGRLRHTAHFRRWRPDRDPSSCAYDQLEVAVPALLTEVFSAGGTP
ncbi:MAG: ATP-dependent DNA ligase [Actinomycetota bacterium]|nr:ATP-dependent DNA ligase [Actinomycetota bacterium]